MTAIHISEGQGLTQALKSYAESKGYDVSGISKQNWISTIDKLETIQQSREENNLNSIYTEVKSDKPYSNMLVHEGDIEFTEGEIESLFVAMGLETKASAYENWTVSVIKNSASNNDVFQLKSDDSHDQESYTNDLAAFADEYIKNYDSDGDNEISYVEFKNYELAQVQDNTIKTDEQALKAALETLETTFEHINVDTEETKNTLDRREIMNLFFSMDSLDSKQYLADGYVSADSYITMAFALADDSSDKSDIGNAIFGFLSRNYNAYFKNYNK